MAQKAQEAKGTETSQTQSQASPQTSPSQQAGSNQPQQRGMTQSGSSQQSRGLSRQGQFSSMNPFSFMRRFSEEMDRLFEDFGFGGSGLLSPSFSRSFLSPGFGRESESAMWSPQAEVFQRGDQLVIRADLPGMTKDDINVDIEDDQIIIRGERRNEREQNEQGFYHTERSYGSFYRSIPLPQGIDAEQANAAFNNGVLEITMPMPAQKSRGRRLEIGEVSERTGQPISSEKTKSAKQ